MAEGLIGALRAAVEAAPGNHAVRLQLGLALLQEGEGQEALLHARAILGTTPDDHGALELASRAATALGDDDVAAGYDRLLGALGARLPSGGMIAEPHQGADADDDQSGFLIEKTARFTLADVGGMVEVKRELQRSFLGPMRNPDVGAHYGVDFGGGLLLYGPPGCGKTLLARAVAGELGAQFLSLGLQDVLDMWLGMSERRLHEAFAEAHRRAPCVLFFDEIDALGQKRGNLKGGAGRNVVNQLLSEMDGLGSAGDNGVFVLAATNHPWDVDSALRRPGRFDRSLLVLPPDREARAAIFDLQLKDKPVEAIDVPALAKRTSGYSGADLALVCRTAVQTVMGEAAETERMRPVNGKDLLNALHETSPSTRPWFQLAYNYAAFSNEDGTYDDLLAYIRKHRLT